MKELGRLLTAMVTPFDQAGEVDYEQAKKLAVALLESGATASSWWRRPVSPLLCFGKKKCAC